MSYDINQRETDIFLESKHKKWEREDKNLFEFYYDIYSNWCDDKFGFLSVPIKLVLNILISYLILNLLLYGAKLSYKLMTCSLILWVMSPILHSS